MKKIKFNVFGMTCSSCQSHIEKAVSSLNGIKKVNVKIYLDEKKNIKHMVFIQLLAEKNLNKISEVGYQKIMK